MTLTKAREELERYLPAARQQAADRLEWLHDHGPGPRAFTFKQAYNPDGAPVEIDRARVKALIEANAPGQSDLLERLRNIPV